MFNWLKKNRRERILAQAFPPAWKKILQDQMVHYRYLDETERNLLEQLIQVFVAEKNFEGCGDLQLTDTIRVLIAAQASLLILQLPHDVYRRVNSILVYPTTVYAPGYQEGLETNSPILGQAFVHGPVILVWDAVKSGAIHPERGHNVVYHEFAHKLDMLDGEVDGVPPLYQSDQYQQWYDVCSTAFNNLQRKSTKGRRTFLDPYGATNPAEFFAVATEYFFDKPRQMKRRVPVLYQTLQNYFNQDPAQRERLFFTK